MLFDTHAHLDSSWFDEDRDEVIKKIRESGVSLVMNVGADMQSSEDAIRLSEKYDFIYAAVGVHPHDADSMTCADIEKLKKMASHRKVCAIGEIGLDYHYDNSDRKNQIKWFEAQMELAKEVNKPVIIHDREAHKDTMDVLKKCGIESTGGVFHCFSGSVEMAKEALELGMYISIAGPITYKNAAKLPDVAAAVPFDRLLIETDSPYLSPVPLRGKRNDCANVRYVAEKIAEIRGISVEEVAAQTLKNGCEFFGISL